MKITWLGQAGLLFETANCKVMVDPYLSDSVSRLDVQKRRRIPVKEELFDLKPNVIAFTHNHLDHYDPETADHFITAKSGVTVLSPISVWQEVRQKGGNNNFVMFNTGTSWTEGDIRVTAVKAEHSDTNAIGVIIDDGMRKHYVTGDTLYNEKVFRELPDDIYAVFLPVNGAGNNMNLADAVRFCERVRPEFAVPIHWGMLDDMKIHSFPYDRSIIPQIYEEIVF